MPERLIKKSGGSSIWQSSSNSMDNRWTQTSFHVAEQWACSQTKAWTARSVKRVFQSPIVLVSFPVNGWMYAEETKQARFRWGAHMSYIRVYCHQHTQPAIILCHAGQQVMNSTPKSPSNKQWADMLQRLSEELTELSMRTQCYSNCTERWINWGTNQTAKPVWLVYVFLWNMSYHNQPTPSLMLPTSTCCT